MIRTILKLEKRLLELMLPSEFLGKQIEVIAFVLEESEIGREPRPSGKSFSAIELDTRRFKFNREEANER